MFLVSRCPGCGRSGAAPCARCVDAMEPASGLPAIDGLDWCRALLEYDGPAREVVVALKYRNARTSASWLAEGMSRVVVGFPSHGGGLQVVTWAPTTDQRRHRRGFDHAEVLARRVAAGLGLPVAPLLHRLPGPPQTGRTLEQRRTGPRFVASDRSLGTSILLVDDVVTTGATMAAAAAALRHKGARQVAGVAAAHPS